LLNRDVPDGEIGSALNLAKATYSRRKEAADFPNFAELIAVGEAFGLSARALQIAFGWRGEDELILLDTDEIRQFMDQAGSALFGNERVRRYIQSRAATRARRCPARRGRAGPNRLNLRSELF
jgi:hypothetical protein